MNRAAHGHRSARGRVRNPFLVVFASLIVAATAVSAKADVVTNTLDTSPDRTLEQMNLQAGHPDGSTSIVVIPQSGDGDPVCNIDPGETLILQVVSGNPTVATVSPTELTFTACNVALPITVHAVAGGTTEVLVSVEVNNTGPGQYQNAANFAALVSPADPGAPDLESGSNPNNTGAYTLNWDESDVGGDPYSWGFIGCSNTHDVVWGYQDVSTKHMFWPASFAADHDPYNNGAFNYSIEGQTIYRWSEPTNPFFSVNWGMFDRMKATYDGGADPPVVWVQLCENINPGTDTYHISDYDEVASLLATLRQHAPTSQVYISPLQSYEANADGTLVCTMMNGTPPGGPDAVEEGTTFATQAVDDGLALAGPGASGVPNLGPLTFDPPYIDVNDVSKCHPNGNPKHGAGAGSDFLGAQLAAFFDPMAPDSQGNSLTYTLFHQDANDAAATVVASGLTTNSYTFASEPEGTWKYFVQAVDTVANPNLVLSSSLSTASASIVTDKTPPSAPVLTAPPPDFAGNGGWYKDSVAVTSAGDGDPNLADGSPGAGVDAGSIGPVQSFTTSGSHTATGTVFDLAGNESPAGTLAVQVDADPPSVTVNCPAPLTLGTDGSATWTASDAESGLASGGTGAVTLSAAAVGPKTASAPVAQDNVGHTTSKTCSYAVDYDYSGFFQPVDMGDIMNVSKAGSAIPVKFSLAGDQGLGILANGSPTTSVVDCNNGDDLDNIEETVTAGQSSLTYDPVAGQYVYVWKTQKTWSNTCRSLTVTLIDGTTHVALFKFTK